MNLRLTPTIFDSMPHTVSEKQYHKIAPIKLALTPPPARPIIHVQDLSIESIQSTCYPPRIGLETQADKKVPTSPKLKIIGEKYQKLEVEAYQNIRDRLEGLDINGSLVVSIQNF